MPKKGRKKNKSFRQAVAVLSKNERSARTDEQQLAELDRRPGNALRERTRLGVRINLLKKGNGNG